MPPDHASPADQPLALGVPVVCLNVADLAASTKFYAALGFKVASEGENPNQVALTHPSVELQLYQGLIPANTLCFYRCDLPALEVQFAAAGVSFTAAKLAPDGPEGWLLTDPSDLRLYFMAGAPLGAVAPGSSAEPAADEAALPYGSFAWALPVADARAGVEFLKPVGFTIALEDAGEDYQWIELCPPGCADFRLTYCQNVTPGQMLMFFGGDVYAIEQVLISRGLTMDIPAQQGFDGVDSMMLRDPDGNMVCFHGPAPQAAE